MFPKWWRRDAEPYDPDTVEKVGDAGPQRGSRLKRRADADERDDTLWLGDVYQTGDSGPPKSGTHTADADERDATTLGGVYKTGDAGPQRPGSTAHHADADERTEARSGQRPRG